MVLTEQQVVSALNSILDKPEYENIDEDEFYDFYVPDGVVTYKLAELIKKELDLKDSVHVVKNQLDNLNLF